MQRRVNPFSEGRIRLNLLGSEQCYPTWDPLNTDTLIAARLETIYYAERGTRQLDRDDRANHEGRQLYTKRFTQIITRDQIIEQYHGDQPVVRPNPLGEIPLVHIKNLGIPKEYYGLPDAQDLIDLQRELNEKATDISDIINYHCVDGETEILTNTGWRKYTEVAVGDKALCLDPATDQITWQPIDKVNVFEHKDDLVQWDNRIDALTTPNHRWLVERKVGRPENTRYERLFARTSETQDGDPAVSELRYGSRVILGGGTPAHFPEEAVYSDELVETIGWLVTEGCLLPLPSGSHQINLSQSEAVNPEKVEAIRRLQAYWKSRGETFSEQKVRSNGVVCWILGTNLTAGLLDVAPGKSLTPKFLTSLTFEQAEKLLEVLIDADGTRLETGRRVWYQDDQGRVDGFQMLSAMVSGARTRSFKNIRGDGVVDTYQTRTIEIASTVNRAKLVKNKSGVVWCPTTPTGTWFARRNGHSYWTGNSAPITVITGAKAKQLERGPRQIWSGLPEKARVENLVLQADLAAATNYWENIKKSLFELSDIPEGSLGSMQPISNTSGVALHMQFQPLLEKTDRKKIQYQPGFEQLNYFILRIGMVKGLINLPMDLCDSCGGRIIELETDKTTKVWDPRMINPNDGTIGYFVETPIRKKKCFHIDKQTLDFTDPYDMRLKVWRQFGFGNQLVEMRLKDIEKQIKAQDGSFWDYTVIQTALLDKWKTKNLTPEQKNVHDQVAGAKVFPLETATESTQSQQQHQMHSDAAAATTKADGNPKAPPKPPGPPSPHPVPPPGLQILPLPPSEIDIPPEPEEVTIQKVWNSPVTGQPVLTEEEQLFLVPTECKRPKYLNPFKTKVTFLDVLPKDEAQQANLYQVYQTQGWVDAEWARTKIPEIAADRLAIEKRVKDRMAATMRMEPSQMTSMGGQGVEGQSQVVYQELSPQPPDQASVPGPGGNPTPMGSPNAPV